MKEVKEKISELVEMALPDEHHFLVDVMIRGSKGMQKVQVFVDGDNGINIETCSGISRILSKELDNLDLIDGKYTLEVSSPGVDYPLNTIRQFRKNIGRYLEIKKKDNERIRAKLTGVNDNGILLLIDDNKEKESERNKIHIGFNEIEFAKVIVMFQ